MPKFLIDPQIRLRHLSCLYRIRFGPILVFSISYHASSYDLVFLSNFMCI